MDFSTLRPLQDLAIATALGLLVGLERERSKAPERGEVAAGVRTMPLIALWGTLAAKLSETYTPWILTLSIVGLAALLVANYWWTSKREEGEPGMTTSVAVFLTFFLGLLVADHQYLVAVVAAVGMTALLAFKPQIHKFAKGLSQDDVQSILEFVVLMAVVLPLLPNQPVDPQGALIPREVGLMVTLIAGIGLSGFLLVRLLGTGRGLMFTGALGGLVSSTALVFSFSRFSAKSGRAAKEFGLAMALACTVMYPRVLFEAAAVGPKLLIPLMLPIGGMLGASLVAWWLLQRKANRTTDVPEEMEIKNPTELTTAVKFGLLYAAVRWLSSFFSANLRHEALYALALVAGTTDVNAITLSMSRLGGEEIPLLVAARTVTIAAVSNTLVKGGIAWVIASPEARRTLAIILGAAAGAGVGAFFLLPLFF